MTIPYLECPLNRSNSPQGPIGELTLLPTAILASIGPSVQLEVRMPPPSGPQDSVSIVGFSASS